MFFFSTLYNIYRDRKIYICGTYERVIKLSYYILPLISYMKRLLEKFHLLIPKMMVQKWAYSKGLLMHLQLTFSLHQCCVSNVYHFPKYQNYLKQEQFLKCVFFSIYFIVNRMACWRCINNFYIFITPSSFDSVNNWPNVCIPAPNEFRVAHSIKVKKWNKKESTGDIQLSKGTGFKKPFIANSRISHLAPLKISKFSFRISRQSQLRYDEQMW